MKKAIWKYATDVSDDFAPWMPEHAQVIHVHGQGSQICIWAIVDPTAPLEVRKFQIYGTGHTLKNNPGAYLGTAHTFDGRVVWHVFEAAK